MSQKGLELELSFVAQKADMWKKISYIAGTNEEIELAMRLADKALAAREKMTAIYKEILSLKKQDT